MGLMIDYTYAYASLAVAVFLVWLVLWFLRPDLRRLILSASIPGAIFGPISEYWYFADYWKPPSMFGIASYSPEDVLFGFAIMGIVVSLFDVVMKTKDSVQISFSKLVSLYVTMLFLVVGVLLFFTTWLGCNSVIVVSTLWLVLAAFIAFRRPDFRRVILVSGILNMLLIVPIYIVLFDVVFPEFVARYWLLANGKLGFVIGRSLPWTELLWYFSLGGFSGVMIPFVSGARKIRA